MLEQQDRPRSSVAPSDRGDSIDPADGITEGVPATLTIDLELDPVAYHYESWSEMADDWVESLRFTAESMPDPDHDRIRNVTPLVPLSDVEALIEQTVVAGESDITYGDAGITRREELERRE